MERCGQVAAAAGYDGCSECVWAQLDVVGAMFCTAEPPSGLLSPLAGAHCCWACPNPWPAGSSYDALPSHLQQLCVGGDRRAGVESWGRAAGSAQQALQLLGEVNDALIAIVAQHKLGSQKVGDHGSFIAQNECALGAVQFNWGTDRQSPHTTTAGQTTWFSLPPRPVGSGCGACSLPACPVRHAAGEAAGGGGAAAGGHIHAGHAAGAAAGRAAAGSGGGGGGGQATAGGMDTALRCCALRLCAASK